jgi:hypothetical protein
MTTGRRSALIAGIAAGIVLYFFDPATTAWFPVCPFRALTGWNCPGCGSLRALHALLHLDIGSALRANAVTTSTVIGLALAAGLRAFGRGADAFARLTTPPALARVLIVTALFGIVRNIPVRPFTWLIP